MTLDIELKRAYKTGKIIIGIKDSEKAILFGNAKGLIVSKSAKREELLKLEYYAKIGKIPFLEVDEIPLALGELIGLSYPVNALTVIDEGKSKILNEIKE